MKILIKIAMLVSTVLLTEGRDRPSEESTSREQPQVVNRIDSLRL